MTVEFRGEQAARARTVVPYLEPDLELSAQGQVDGQRPRRRRWRPGALIQGRYSLLDRLGAGGMASVYRARDELLGRYVAVKLIAERLAGDPPFVERFRQEARLCARLTHSNIVAVLGAGDRPCDFIVTEFVDGLDAGNLLHRRGRLTLRETVHVVAQICDALTYVHEHGVIHCDVSPSNILLRCSDGAAKLADFGLACRAADVASWRAGGVLGTPGYVAPEVLWGAEPTPRSDLYCLGVVAYQFLVGPTGWCAGDAGGTAPLATASPWMPPLAEVRPDLPRGLLAAVEQAVALEPHSRQHSVAEFRAQLIGNQIELIRARRARARHPEPVRAALPRAA